MRTLWTILVLAASSLTGSAQVSVDVPIRMTGATADRGVDGLDEPISGTSAVTVRASVVHGGFTWSQAVLVQDTFVLTSQPAVDGLTDGLLLRFPAPANAQGNLFIRCGANLPSIPLVRPDGLAPTRGQILAGTVCEVLNANGKFVLINASGSGCPPGFLPATARVCMEITPVPGMLFHPARDRCANLGGKLCTWDEFIVGCTVLSGQLVGQFADWEWMDDTSNHSHGSDLFGQLTCQSMRNVGALTTFTAASRCCYHPR